MLVVEDERAALDAGRHDPGRGRSGTPPPSPGPRRWEESREGLARAIPARWRRPAARPEEIDVVFADALGVPAADRAEALAIADALGAHGRHGYRSTAPKTGTGRAYCGAPVLDTAAAVLAMEHGLVPPTPNVSTTCATTSTW